MRWVMRPNFDDLVITKSQPLDGAPPKMSWLLEGPFSKIVTKIFKSRHTHSPLWKTLYSRPCPHAIVILHDNCEFPISVVISLCHSFMEAKTNLNRFFKGIASTVGSLRYICIYMICKYLLAYVTQRSDPPVFFFDFFFISKDICFWELKRHVFLGHTTITFS